MSQISIHSAKDTCMWWDCNACREDRANPSGLELDVLIKLPLKCIQQVGNKEILLLILCMADG